MPIQLNGSTSGSVQVDVPAAVSGGDISLTLPNGVGSANQFLKNSGTAGTLEFVTHRGFVSYAIICDQKDKDTDGGTFTSGAMRTRDLNTEISDTDGIVSISSNQFTLAAGDYLISWRCPAYEVDTHFTQLRNITDSTTAGFGSVEYAHNESGVTIKSNGWARVSITGSKAFEVQHQGGSTKSSIGFGSKTNASGFNSIYTIVEIYKEA
tara:strand:+ start:1553 stop:2179 length:627 start_codon:yes stop_codon:yes gene_type:complete